MMVERRTPGPAYANLQWRKPRGTRLLVNLQRDANPFEIVAIESTPERWIFNGRAKKFHRAKITPWR
jgi:hypothetical protein